MTWSRVPWWTLAVLAVALVLSDLSGMAQQLQFEPARVWSGEWWRSLSGHLVHCSPDHLWWNVFAFGALGAACEMNARRGFLCMLALSAIVVPVALSQLQPELISYRGLSGLASGCFTLLAVRIARQATAQGERWRVVAAWGLLGLFAAKTVFELVRGDAVFTDAAAGGFVPVPAAHVVAGAVGLVVGCVEGGRRQRPCRSHLNPRDGSAQAS